MDTRRVTKESRSRRRCGKDLFGRRQRRENCRDYQLGVHWLVGLHLEEAAVERQ